jgi:hypothetical protein
MARSRIPKKTARGEKQTVAKSKPVSRANRDATKYLSNSPADIEDRADLEPWELDTEDQLLDDEELVEEIDGSDQDFGDEDFGYPGDELPSGAGDFLLPVRPDLGSRLEVEEAANVVPGDVCALLVLPGDGADGKPFCRPVRVRRPSSGSAWHGARRIDRILDLLAAWFENRRPAFLVNPTPENLAREEEPGGYRLSSCVVLQQGLIANLLAFRSLPEQVRQENLESDFSRLSERIWLFWPRKGFCCCLGEYYRKNSEALERLRRAWVLGACLPAYRKAGPEFREQLCYGPEYHKTVKKNAGKEGPEECNDPEEWLALVAGRLGMKIEKLFGWIREELDESEE